MIARIAARGDGVTGDGRNMPLAAPGDRLLDSGALEAGPHRAVPPCRHFPQCGGCQLQHVDQDALSAFVTRRVLDALAGQQVQAASVASVHLSPERTRRRASLHALKLRSSLLLGFNQERSRRIVDMQECHILEPRLFSLVQPIRALLSAVLPTRGHAEVKLALVDQGVEILLTGVSDPSFNLREQLTSFAGSRQLARLAVDSGYGPEVLWEPEPVTVSFGGVSVRYPPHAFLQPTADGEAALVEAVGQALGQAERVVDLFAGLGTFAFALQTRLAVEGDRAAAEALSSAAKQRSRLLAVEHRDLYRRPLEPGELSRFDGVILDPPRSGAREQVVRLAELERGRIAYVSCNPSSFARDARILTEAGWRLERIWPVGQFRWSTHVELVGAFLR